MWKTWSASTTSTWSASATGSQSTTPAPSAGPISLSTPLPSRLPSRNTQGRWLLKNWREPTFNLWTTKTRGNMSDQMPLTTLHTSIIIIISSSVENIIKPINSLNTPENTLASYWNEQWLFDLLVLLSIDKALLGRRLRLSLEVMQNKRYLVENDVERCGGGES